MGEDKFTGKADLVVTKKMYVDGKLVLEPDDKIEVKKIDYKKDSYFSEFFAIYKNKKSNKKDEIQTLLHDDKIRTIYKLVIEGLFDKLNTSAEGKRILEDIRSGFSGMMFDNDRLILTCQDKKNCEPDESNIELYWSTTGARDCKKEPRLTIRYRVKNPNPTIYIYDKSDRKSTRLNSSH